MFIFFSTPDLFLFFFLIPGDRHVFVDLAKATAVADFLRPVALVAPAIAA
jgi:hypothetical protein